MSLWHTERKEVRLLTSRFYISDISKGKALRASRYYRVAEFFLHPTPEVRSL